MTNGTSGASAIATNAVQTFVARVLASVLGIAVGIAIAKVLGPDGKGIFSGVQAFLSIPLALIGGMGAAITYFMTKERRTIAELFPALAVSFAVVTIALWTAVAVWAFAFGRGIVPIAIIVAAPASIVLAWQPSYYIATGQMRRLNVQTLALAGAMAVSIVGALLARAGIVGVLGAWIACSYVLAIVVLADVVRHGGHLHRTALREQLTAFARLGGHSGINMSLGALNYRVDSLVLVAMLGFASFGIYSVAVAVGEVLFWLTRPITAAVSREIGLRDSAGSADITARTIRICVAVVAIVSSVVFAFGPWLIDAIYGPRFSAAGEPLRWLLPGIVVFSTAGTFVSYFLFQVGRPSIVTTVNIAMIVAQVGACILLVPRLGMTGAAIASSATYLVGAAVNTAWFCRLTGYGPVGVWIIRRSDIAQIIDVVFKMLPGRGRWKPASSTIEATKN